MSVAPPNFSLFEQAVSPMARKYLQWVRSLRALQTWVPLTAWFLQGRPGRVKKAVRLEVEVGRFSVLGLG